jgi:hypothetical protein
MRAPRYQLRIPLRYRPLGESTWTHGATENISRTGVLVRSKRILPPNTSLEIQFLLSSDEEVACSGTVVRTAGELGESAGLGAVIVPKRVASD